MPQKKKKSLKYSKSRTISTKPEKIFKVVSKKRTTIKKKTHRKRKQITPKSAVSRKVMVITIGIAIFCAFCLLLYSGKQMLDALHEAEIPAGSLELSKEAAADLKLLGSKSQYPKEIINYQSVPADMQEFVLRDYTLHKANCIVNGQFVGDVRYEIVNVVYDKFARISKDCNGSDTLILAKMSGIWTVIVSGNDLPLCKVVNAFDIPQGITYKCREGFVTYTNPNP